MQEMIQTDAASDRLREECGVFGIYDLDGADVASTIYYGLFALQHRGQESCGIAVSETYGPKGKVTSHKDMGLVSESFTADRLKSMKGDIGVGHVRYSTAGASTRENAQPLVLNYVKGTLALAHNGNLINALELRHDLEYTGAIFQTTIDSEVIAYHIARERLHSATVEEAVRRATRKMKGAYSLVAMSPRKLIGARDPFGFRPLCIGKRDNAYIITSETCALDTIGAEFIRDVLPGEVVTITENGELLSDMTNAIAPERQGRCIFEYIYFSRTDSRFDGVSVYDARIMAGRFLAKDSPVEADLVVGVPESGNAAALGYAMESGIPYGVAFMKNSYVGRTFIKPKQSSREQSVRVKLNVIREAVEGKRIIMIDDSIVRGTTSNLIVNMLKEGGAREVHVRISSPPFLWPCYFGTDIPVREQLIAYNRTVEDIRQVIGTDSLAYLKNERLDAMAGGLPICRGCFTGKYPLDPPEEDIRGDYER
ncbi:MAG: amidophosphoribosyltransferase [Clostridiales bacterium]|nr:amidophosphoribosyltransferase [Clostridiales bacterium]